MPANLHTITAQDIASWPTPDYVNAHGERRPWLGPFSLVWLSASTLLVLMRLGLRFRKQGGGLGWDDVSIFDTELRTDLTLLKVFLIASWMFLVGFTSCIMWAVENDIITRHIWDVLPSKLVSDGMVRCNKYPTSTAHR